MKVGEQFSEKKETGHQFPLKAFELKIDSFRKNRNWSPVFLKRMKVVNQFF
jgi:hypothetical protein